MFNRPNDIGYGRFLRRLHKDRLFDWYMEVGCRAGRSFADVRGKTIAVDPSFRIDSNVIKDKPALHIFQQTSDDFFDSGFLKAAGAKLSFSFLDGMHLFEYLLRDFINTEKNSHPDSVIALHDCCPFSLEMTTRDLDNTPADAWTGDVWKLIPILQEHRPDLTITVLGCKPTGLVLISNLNPRSTKLRSRYDKIVAEWEPITLEAYGVARFYNMFDYTPCSEIVEGGFKMFDGVRLPEEADQKPAYHRPMLKAG